MALTQDFKRGSDAIDVSFGPDLAVLANIFVLLERLCPTGNLLGELDMATLRVNS